MWLGFKHSRTNLLLGNGATSQTGNGGENGGAMNYGGGGGYGAVITDNGAIHIHNI